jgi:hypothetical protein
MVDERIFHRVAMLAGPPATFFHICGYPLLYGSMVPYLFTFIYYLLTGGIILLLK